MAWTPVTPIAVDMPGTAEWANMVQDNPIAIAGGESGAPKNMGVSLGGVWLGAGRGTDTGAGTYTGLGRVRLIRLGLWFAGAATITVRFTADNGATWGARQNTTLSSSAPSGTMAEATLDLQTGVFAFSGLSFGGSVDSIYGSNTLTVPANTNGFNIGLTGSQILAHQAYIIGGRA